MESVVVSARVNAMSRASVVEIVLPPLYAACNVEAEGGHLITLLDASRQSVFEELAGVVNPSSVKYESASVTILIPLVPEGCNVT